MDVLREDPDVIVVGELREPENIRLTLNAAESGHIVIATLHASNSEDAIYRICNSFPPESQDEIRFQLASTLSWIIVQQLMYLDRVKFRIPVMSICRGTQSIKSIIRENKLPQIENAIHTGKNEGMFTMSRYMSEYIDAQQTFNHPSKCFKPSEEVVHEKVYVSPLLGFEPVEATAAEAFTFERDQKMDREMPVSKTVSKEITDEDGDPQYVISEKEDLRDLIKKIDQSIGSTKSKK